MNYWSELLPHIELNFFDFHVHKICSDRRHWEAESETGVLSKIAELFFQCIAFINKRK